jgi:hypothetical protein
MIKSRRMRWVEYVTRMEEMRNAYRIVYKENLKGRDNSEDLDVDGKIIL